MNDLDSGWWIHRGGKRPRRGDVERSPAITRGVSMPDYRLDFGRVQAFLLTVCQELHLLALDAHQVDYWLAQGDAEQTLCALKRCEQRADFIGRQCRHLRVGEGQTSVLDVPREVTG
jgi:hypothetical protein